MHLPANLASSLTYLSTFLLLLKDVAAISAPSVKTSSGLVSGHVAPNMTNVTQYLGIPYAQPPVGNLRFRVPQKYKNASAVVDGSAFGAICATSGKGANFTFPNAKWFESDLLSGVPSSEDCLTVNVWVANTTVAAKEKCLKPVMVWFYGGGFSSGGTNTSLYNGQYFAGEEDVVLVNFNYRTSVFGFSGAPGLRQNVGLLDQRMAVEWVSENIANFGGDPERITIFGESAGAISVGYYNYAWRDDPLIAGSIMQSGTQDGLGNAFALPKVTAGWDNVTVTLGCGNASAPHTKPQTVVTCMQSPNITTAAILAAVGSYTGGANLFYPAVDNRTVYEDYVGLTSNGSIARKPVLLGNNNYEFGFFAQVAGLDPSIAAAFETSNFTCPSRDLAGAYASQGIPVWRYLYSGMFDNLLLPSNNITQAYHTSEVPIVFGTTQEVSGKTNSPVETKLSKYMRSAWAAFATDPCAGLERQFGWPKYSNETKSLILLGQNNETTARFEYPSVIDSVC